MEENPIYGNVTYTSKCLGYFLSLSQHLSVFKYDVFYSAGVTPVAESDSPHSRAQPSLDSTIVYRKVSFSVPLISDSGIYNNMKQKLCC